MRLGLVLGDQLSFDLASLASLDPARDAVLMAEVEGEARYVPHHPLKIILIFSAMRHFAQALRERGWQVHYVELDAEGNSGSIVGELRRWQQALGATHIHLTECGEWRLEQALRDAELPLVWFRDTRFLCSREAFGRWATERRQLRMEHFYRGMRKRTGLLMEPDGSPAGGAWNFDGDNRKPLPRQLRGPFAAHFAQDDITAAVVALVIASVAGFYLLGKQGALVQWAALIVGLVAAAGVFLVSESGRQFVAFAKDAWREVKKVVWPTRKETLQMTAYVFAFVVIMALFLWFTDKTLEWVLYDLILGWRKS